MEGVTAQRIDSVSEMEEVLPEDVSRFSLIPKERQSQSCIRDVVVDAIIAKKNLGTTKEMAPLVIGVGPRIYGRGRCGSCDRIDAWT